MLFVRVKYICFLTLKVDSNICNLHLGGLILGVKDGFDEEEVLLLLSRRRRYKPL